MDERELIGRCLRGETAAFGPLVEKYQTPVLAVAYGILRDREEARDAAQEAFLQAYSHLASFDAGRPFKNWLLAIATKRSLDRVRRRRTFLGFLRRYEGYLGHGQESAESAVQAEDFFEKMVGRLNRRERSVISLKISGDFSFTEIADLLGCSESTVRVHYFNARRKLRRRMNDESRTGDK